MTAYGYIRISQEDQSNYSIDSQERYIREYCQRYNLTLKQIFTDNGESSYTFDRTQFNKLEERIRAEKIASREERHRIGWTSPVSPVSRC